MKTRLKALSEAAGLIEDGATLGLGGLMLYNKPMALIREIIRQGTKNLTVICAAPSTIDADQLIGAGAVGDVIFQSLTVERAGPVAPQFRLMAEQGRVGVVDCDQGMIHAGLRAAQFGLPSLPTVAGVGSDLPAVRPDWFKELQDPFTGRPIVQVRAMVPDVAIVHSAVCDEFGHAQQLGDAINDLLLCSAAKRIIVTTERIVSSQEIQRSPGSTFSWAYKVAAVVEAPYGAHPLGTYGCYPWDGRHLKAYALQARTEDGFKEYCERFITGLGSHVEYLEQVGWPALLGLRANAGRFDSEVRNDGK